MEPVARVEEALRAGWADLGRHAGSLAALPAFIDQPRLNLGSLRQPEASSFLGPPRTRWLRRSGKGQGHAVLATPLALVVGTCDTEPTPDHFECVDFEVQALHPDQGDRLFSIEDRYPLGACRDVLVCLSADLAPVLEGRSLLDGELLWSLRPSLPHPTGLVAPDGIYLWTRSSQGEGGPLYHPWPDPRRRPAEPEPVPGLEPGRIGYVDRFGSLLAVQTWWTEPVRDRLDVLRHPGGGRVWERPTEDREYTESDLIPHASGWILRTSREVRSYDRDGRLLGSAPGLARCWLGPRCLVGARPGDDEVVVVDRGTGEHRPLGFRFPWDLAVAGDTVWAVLRREGVLLGVTTEGEPLWQGPQASLGDLGLYGIRRLIPYAGRLYAMGDDGSLACFESTP